MQNFVGKCKRVGVIYKGSCCRGESAVVEQVSDYPQQYTATALDTDEASISFNSRPRRLRYIYV